MVCRIPSRRAASIALCGLLHLPGLSAVDPECRDRFYWPFSNASIWNTPIGSNASFVPAEIYNISYSVGCALRIGAAASLRTVCPGWNTTWTPAVCLTVGCCYDPITPDPNDVPWCYRPGGRPPQWGFHNDGDLIVLSTASNPIVPWLNQGNWNPGNHCSATGPQATAVPLPADFVTPCGGGNNAMALLLPDNCTLVQMQPAFRRRREPSACALSRRRPCPISLGNQHHRRWCCGRTRGLRLVKHGWNHQVWRVAPVVSAPSTCTKAGALCT